MPWQQAKPSAPRTRLDMITITREAAVAAVVVVEAPALAEWSVFIFSCRDERGLAAASTLWVLMSLADDEEEEQDLPSFIAFSTGVGSGTAAAAAVADPFPAPNVHVSCSRYTKKRGKM